MSLVVEIFDLIVNARFGPITRGATKELVRDALGEADTHSNPGVVVEPMSIWVYGKSLCRGHLEFHFMEDKLWSIFADYLPLRRYRSTKFRFDPGCLGGLVLPSVNEVRRALEKAAAPVPRCELVDPRWGDPPPREGARIGTRVWNKAVRQARAKDANSAYYAQLIWPSGASLGIGYHHAVAANGERMQSEDVVQMITVPMSVEDNA